MRKKELVTKRQDLTFGEFLLLSGVGEVRKDFQELFRQLEKPEKVCGKELPDMDNLTLGDLLQLQDIKDIDGLLDKGASVLLDLPKNDLMKEKAIEVLSFASWIIREIERINKLFAANNLSPTKEEIQAGVENMDFGSFGIVDYYAQRMGFQDHEEVLKIPWVRVYKCMEIDSKKSKYERDLAKVYARKNKI